MSATTQTNQSAPSNNPPVEDLRENGESPARSAFFAGARMASPLMLGVAPFGIIAGVVAANTGLITLQSMTYSVIIFAGASQLALVELLGRQAPFAVIVLTALVINLRMSMYSASLAPHFTGVSSWRKLGLSYLLTDQAYAVSITRFQRPMAPGEKVWFYLGSGTLMWCTYQTTTILGAAFGARMPAGWSLDFAVPLTFLALLIPAVRDRASLAAAAAAGLIAVLAAGLPYNLGLILASFSGILVGSIVGWRAKS